MASIDEIPDKFQELLDSRYTNDGIDRDIWLQNLPNHTRVFIIRNQEIALGIISGRIGIRSERTYKVNLSPIDTKTLSPIDTETIVGRFNFLFWRIFCSQTIEAKWDTIIPTADQTIASRFNLPIIGRTGKSKKTVREVLTHK